MKTPQPPSMGVPHLYEVIDKLASSEPGSESASESTPVFAGLLRTVVSAGGGRFGHREHIHLTWLAVRGHGTEAATEMIGDGLRRITAHLGVPQKYNVTMTRAWVELVAHHTDEIGSEAAGGVGEAHAAAGAAGDFDAFAGRNPELLDKRLLSRFYRPATLASDQARTGWVEPDLTPFPWQ